MTLVLMAVDESEESVSAARQARQLFGADATYLAVYVSRQQAAWAGMPPAWGGVYPYPYAAPYPLLEEELARSARDDTVLEEARGTAKALADEAGVPTAEAVGDVGDPTDAILDAADAHHADVIVVGGTHKGWWRRLIEGSVSEELVRRSRRPVLIAGQEPSSGV